MKARYFFQDKSWILVTILEKIGDLYRVYPTEWVGIESKDIYVPEHLLEFVFSDKP